VLNKVSGETQIPTLTTKNIICQLFVRLKYDVRIQVPKYNTVPAIYYQFVCRSQV